MVQITAKRLVKNLVRSGFVLIKGPPARVPLMPSTGL